MSSKRPESTPNWPLRSSVRAEASNFAILSYPPLPRRLEQDNTSRYSDVE